MASVQPIDFLFSSEDSPSTTPDFLSRLSERDRSDLLALAGRTELHKGDLIFKVGDTATHVYMLDSGRAKIYHPSAGGKEVLLWFCFPHDLFGLAEINHGGSRQATAELCERSVVLSVERDDFHRFVQQRPAVSLLVIDLLSQRLRSLGNAMQELVASDVTARLVMLLTRLTTCYGKPSGDAICVDLNITQQELADMIGATRQTVSSILSALRRSGLLYFKNRRIYIVDPHALSEYAVSHAEA